MPSHLHETLRSMFHNRPDLAAELLAGPLGMTLPRYLEAQLGAAEVTELRPAEHRADAVVVLRDGTDAVFAAVVEVQLSRDDEKTLIWPDYLTGVRRRVRCPTVLLVICADAATAEWAATPIDLDGRGSVVLPAVVGPDLVPVLTDAEQAARTPELSVLSALVHVRDDGPFEVLDAMVGALDRVELEHAVEYARLVLAALPLIARGYLEELMSTDTYEYQSDFTRRLEARGEARGEASMLLRVLAARGLAVDDAACARISACTDPAQFEEWAERAVTAYTVDDLFDRP